MKSYDIYLVGVGGQGILTISDIIMRAAEKMDIPANFFPTKGMAQRGGFVKAQLKLGASGVAPDIRPQGADLVIAMELNESLKALRFLKPGGNFIVYGFQWKPTDVMLGKAKYPAAEDVCAMAEKAGAKVTYLNPADLPDDTADNIYLLGAVLRHSGLNQIIPVEEIRAAIVARWPKAADRNIRSLEAGLAVN